MATSTDLRSAIEEVQNQLPEEQLAGELEGAYEVDFATRLEQRVGALPWWVISTIAHSVLFLLATLIGVAVPPPETDEVIISTDVAKREEPKYDEKKKRDIFKSPQEVKAETQVENPVVVHEQAEVAETFETDNDMDSQSARGSEDAISDIPLGGTGVTGSMGVGGGGMAGCFGYRDGGGRKKAVARFGGSKATESAVEAALRWLVRHQEVDGHWQADKWEAKHDNSAACTGLATLAFLGAGYTEKSGKFRDNVKRAVNWMISQQKENGCLIGKQHPDTTTYTQAICTLALAEAYGMAKVPRTGEAAQKGINDIMARQKPYSGWRYGYKDKQPDSSVTGWCVMALKSAKVAGLKVDGAGFQGTMAWFDSVTMTEQDGRDHHKGKMTGCIGYLKKGWSPTMTAAGMVARQFMGVTRDNRLLQGGAKWLAGANPDWDRKATWRQPGDFYFWYYGTLATFQMGGDSWKNWNQGLKKTLVPHQRKGGPLDGTANDVDGSWDPRLPCRFEAEGGRVYSTALGALCLEVYYRYLPMYSK